MTDGQTEAIRVALRSGGPRAAAHLVDPGWVEHFAIIGTEDECASELGAVLHDNGIDEFQLPVLEVAGAARLIERTAAMFDDRREQKQS
jgi:hypothetical protein